MRMGLRQANQQFSRAIRAVREGEDVVLTERGRPIAIITPWRRGRARERALRLLRAAGLVRGAAKPGPMPRWRPVRIKGEPLSQTVQDMRDER